MKLSKKLSPAVVEGAKPEAEPYRLWDTSVPQLFVRVQPSGIKSFNVQWSRTSSRSLGKWPGVTVEAARQKARDALVETDQQGAPAAVIEANKPASAKPLTFGEYLTQHYEPWALAHQKQGHATIAGIRATYKTFDKKLLTEVCAFDIERIKSQRLKVGRKTSTVNRDLDRIRGALSRAVDWGMLDSHPMRTVKRAKGDDNARVRYLADDEEKRLRGALAGREATRRASRESGNAWSAQRGIEGRPQWPVDGFTDHLMPMVLLAMNTGLRRGELFGLEWTDINMPTKLLTVRAGIAKSRKGRHVPLSREAFDVLTRWKAQSTGRGLVFPGVGGGKLTNINKSWAGLVADAELVDFRFHDCRHDFASKLVMAGVDLNTLRELLGHSDIAMTLRYAHLAPHKLAAAVELLGAKA